MNQYIAEVEKPIATFDTKYGGNNGFDAAYVKQVADGTYQLVIPEAKSGAMGTLTAYGEGSKGDAQLSQNLSVLQKSIDVSTLPRDVKDQLTGQIKNRTFETQLFVGPTSNVNVGDLDFLRSVTGNPVKNVVVLPRKGP